MNILLVNIAHPAIGSRLAGEHLPPLGLLAVGGPLLDAGHSVRLIDGDHDNTPVYALADEIAAARPDALLLGHSGSTPAQPILDELTRLVRPRCPETSIVLGGVFPTFHWADILRSQPQYDYIVRGEGEAVTLALISALAWYSRIGRRVWFWELWQFFLVLRRPKGPLTVREFWERGAQREER